MTCNDVKKIQHPVRHAIGRYAFRVGSQMIGDAAWAFARTNELKCYTERLYKCLDILAEIKDEMDDQEFSELG